MHFFVKPFVALGLADSSFATALALAVGVIDRVAFLDLLFHFFPVCIDSTVTVLLCISVSVAIFVSLQMFVWASDYVDVFLLTWPVCTRCKSGDKRATDHISTKDIEEAHLKQYNIFVLHFLL